MRYTTLLSLVCWLLVGCAEGTGGSSGQLALTCADGEELICHVPPGNPAAEHPKCVGANAVRAHLAHGDRPGLCTPRPPGGDAGSPSDAGTIPGEEDITISIGDVSALEGDSSSEAVTLAFPLTLSGVPTNDVTVRYTTVSGTAGGFSDYVQVNDALVTIPAGETSGIAVVAVIEDLVVELEETFTVALATPTNAVLGDAMAVGTIVDDEDDITISIGDASVVEGDSSSENVELNFPLTLSGVPTKPVTVRVSTLLGTAGASTDYVHLNNALITIPAGAISGIAVVAVIEDLVVELDETFTVALATPTNAVLGDTMAVGTIVDDDDGT